MTTKQKRSQRLKQADSLESIWSNAWTGMKHVLVPIGSQAEFERRSRILDDLLDKVGDDENHPLTALCDLMGRLIEEYEEKTVRIRESSPAEVLAFLIKQHRLKQTDLSSIIPQSNLSAVLKEKRALTPKQIANLSARFNVSPAIFIPKAETPRRDKRRAT